MESNATDHSGELTTQSKVPYNPLIIAHRGYSSLFPDNTMESIEAGLYKADYVEFDILTTKDNQIVVFHDRELSKFTNVATLPHFQSRRTKFASNIRKPEEIKEDWWVKDFTLEELKQLKVQQKSLRRPRLRHQTFRISTLDEVIKEMLFIKQHHLQGNSSGLLIEIKESQQYNLEDERDETLVKKLIECLVKHELASEKQRNAKQLPIIIQSFNSRVLRLLSDNTEQDVKLVHLFEKMELTEEFLRSQILPKSIGVAISVMHANKQTKMLCAAYNLTVFFWTMVDDQHEHLPPELPSFQLAYFHLFNLRMDGIITDFPEKCQEYLNAYKAIQP